MRKEVSLYSERDIFNIMAQMPQIECPISHLFSPGQYIRQLRMKAGTVVMGMHHRNAHVNNFVKGKIVLIMDNEQKEITAPKTFIGQAGRKIAYVLEDTIWENIYQTDITDIDLLEAMFFVKDEHLLDFQAHKFAELSMSKQDDRDDYQQALIDLELTQEVVTSVTDNLGDQIGMPMGNYKVILGLSPIAGQGILATENIEAGETIGPARLGVYRTPLGRYTNHSKTPNAAMLNIGDDMFLVATENITGMTGGLQGTEVTVDYRQVRRMVEIGV